MTATLTRRRNPAVDALADDLLDLLHRIEEQLPTVRSEEIKPRRGSARHVINEVCDVIDRHLFKHLDGGPR